MPEITIPGENVQASLKEVMAFFGMPSKGFAVQWNKLTSEDKAQIRHGIANGTNTY